MWKYSADTNKKFNPFDYQIKYNALSETYELPRLVAKLPSEFLGKNYPTAAQECGTNIIYEINGDAKNVAKLDPNTVITARHANIVIQSIKPEESG